MTFIEGTIGTIILIGGGLFIAVLFALFILVASYGLSRIFFRGE